MSIGIIVEHCGKFAVVSSVIIMVIMGFFITTFKSFLKRITVRKTYSDYCITSEMD